MSKKTEKEIISNYFSELGKKGTTGKGVGGGRPPIPDDQLTPEQKKRRERYEAEKRKKEIIK